MFLDGEEVHALKGEPIDSIYLPLVLAGVSLPGVVTLVFARRERFDWRDSDTKL